MRDGPRQHLMAYRGAMMSDEGTHARAARTRGVCDDPRQYLMTRWDATITDDALARADV